LRRISFLRANISFSRDGECSRIVAAVSLMFNSDLNGNDKDSTTLVIFWNSQNLFPKYSITEQISTTYFPVRKAKLGFFADGLAYQGSDRE
jgi:hypothetical protein